jgi:hypothetical protein
MRAISDLKLLDPNTVDQESMVREHLLRPEVSEIIIAHRPYRSPADLLRVRSLTRRATIDELTTIMASAAAVLPQTEPSPVVQRRETVENGDILAGETVDVFGRRRVYLADQHRNELVSAEFGEDSNLDLATVRFGGVNVWDLPALTRQHREALADLIQGEAARTAARFWQTIQEKVTSHHVESQVRRVYPLSQLLSALQDFTQSVDFLEASHDAPCTASNGCTMVPDFDFKECCDAHDRCYCRGGDEDDRLNCDIQLYECIKSKGHDRLAAIYYWGVRHLGESHFNYTSRHEPVTGFPTVIVIVDNPSAPDCHVTVRIIQVEYRGENVGNDWTYTVAVNGQTTRLLHDQKHNHNATRSFGQLIYDHVERGHCGDNFNLILSANATELDPVGDDNGSKSISYQVSCEPDRISTYDHVLEVKVKDKKRFYPDSTGRLYFLFRIETQCV